MQAGWGYVCRGPETRTWGMKGREQGGVAGMEGAGDKGLEVSKGHVA